MCNESSITASALEETIEEFSSIMQKLKPRSFKIVVYFYTITINNKK